MAPRFGREGWALALVVLFLPPAAAQGPNVVEVQHVATWWAGSCEGTLNADGSSVLGDVAASDGHSASGDVGWAFGERLPLGNVSWRVVCAGEVGVTAAGRGGAYRSVWVVAPSQEQNVVCQYAGPVEAACQGNFSRAVSLVVEAGLGLEPPGSVSLSLAPGWRLVNEGQGSTGVLQAVRAEGQAVGSVRVLIDHVWKVPPEADGAAPAPPAGLGLAALGVVAWLSTRGPSRPRILRQ
jgi:hypothetical protein